MAEFFHLCQVANHMNLTPRILIIEDQAPMRRNLALLLEMEGYEVDTAENGKIGLQRVEQKMPDLVICDVMMPELDGYGVIQALRNDPDTAAIPFIFLTAKGDKSDLRVGMNFGADDYLTKPVVREDVLAAIQARLERARAMEIKLQQAVKEAGSFSPDFSSPEPLRLELGLTAREAEVLLWTAQGKSNADIAMILNISEKTAKQHLGSIFQKLGVDSRNGASFRALEILSKRA